MTFPLILNLSVFKCSFLQWLDIKDPMMERVWVTWHRLWWEKPVCITTADSSLIVTIFSDGLQIGKHCFIPPSSDGLLSTLDHTSMSWCPFVLKVPLFYSAYKGKASYYRHRVYSLFWNARIFIQTPISHLLLLQEPALLARLFLPTSSCW